MKKKEFTLSKDAIKHLDNIKIEKKTIISIKSVTINTNFIFQIANIEKQNDCIYMSTLMDNDYKAGNFILFFNKKDIIPKRGDIISIGQITKCYNQNYHNFLYECRKIEFISTNNNFVIDISKIKNFESQNQQNKFGGDNYMFHKEDIKLSNNNKNYELYKEKEEEIKFDNDNNINNVIDKENPEEKKESAKINSNIIYEEAKNNFDNNNINTDINNEKYSLISELDENSKNINIYVKCIYKGYVREFKNQKNNFFQNYIFSDVRNDKIEGVSFYNESIKLDKIFNVNDIYQINNCMLINNKNNYCKINLPYKLLFNKITKVINITNNNIIKNIFYNIKNEEKKENENATFTPLSNIKNININEIINVYGFILKDYGNTMFYDKNYNYNYYGRKIILGDNSNYKINITFWHPNDLKQEYKEGEILYITNCKVNEFNNKKLLSGIIGRTIKSGFNMEINSKLKKYYSEHGNIENYLDIEIDSDNNKKSDFNELKKISNRNNNYLEKYPEIIFIKNIINQYNNKKNHTDTKFSICAYVKKINHSNKNYYYGCNNCRKKMNDDICHFCGETDKILILHYSIIVADCTTSFWLLLFGNVAENFLGIKAEEYKKIMDKGIYNANKELNLIDNKIKEKQYIFSGKSMHKIYNSVEEVRFCVKYFKYKNKNDYLNLINYLKNFLK